MEERSRYIGVRILDQYGNAFLGIATFMNLGARLEPFGFAARTEADGIDIPSFCCQREGEQDFAAPSNCAALLSTQRDSLRRARRL